MQRRLPSLKALRAFEAGARHLSFTLAAEELHVTQAAISHQVKALEEELGVRLFKRMTRKLALTEAGRGLLPIVREAFDRLAEAAEALRARRDDDVLTVSLTPSFSSKWLVGRLGRFWGYFPEIDLRLHHSIQLVDFAASDVDMAIRAGRGTWPGVESELLFGMDLFPVCSPTLLEGEHPLKIPEDLEHHTLLHEDDREDWVQWLKTAHVKGVEGRRGPVLDDSVVLIQAAVAGRGVALGRSSLIRDELADGRLVAPFTVSLATDMAYYMVYPPGAAENPKVRAFCDFLREEAEHDLG